jgi:hypothetical protein
MNRSELKADPNQCPNCGSPNLEHKKVVDRFKGAKPIGEDWDVLDSRYTAAHGANSALDGGPTGYGYADE